MIVQVQNGEADTSHTAIGEGGDHHHCWPKTQHTERCNASPSTRTREFPRLGLLSGRRLNRRHQDFQSCAGRATGLPVPRARISLRSPICREFTSTLLRQVNGEDVTYALDPKQLEPVAR
jgi:hypothetical protein